ncbi:hypothetical protein CMI46_02060 [Candidatus Pacearchaeota archaeon]|nr:hypothetical protein [Candidatus Pacearchaeota archaeon]|tara:strand:+ start:15017 stop:15322 length:306 start_codon:yes stop_codon:yes gene_type:complete
MKPDEEISKAEKLENEIDSLKSKIRNTEYDVKNMFKGNALVEEKLNNSKKLLDEKQKLLEEVKKNPKSEEALEKVEEKIVEGEAISEEQAGIIKDSVEKEI